MNPLPITDVAEYIEELLAQVEDLQREVKYLRGRVAALPATKMTPPAQIAPSNAPFWGLQLALDLTAPIKCVNCEE